MVGSNVGGWIKRLPRALLVLYSSLVALLLASIGLTIIGHALGWGWTDTWMPNFIAEWSGIFFAVLVVERLIERERQQRIEREQEPLKQAAALTINRAVAPLAAAGVLHCGGNDVDPYEKVTDWIRSFPFAERDPGWTAVRRRAIAESRAQINNLRERYGHLLDPDELVTVDYFRDQLSDENKPLGFTMSRIAQEFDIIARRLSGGLGLNAGGGEIYLLWEVYRRIYDDAAETREDG